MCCGHFKGQQEARWRSALKNLSLTFDNVASRYNFQELMPRNFGAKLARVAQIPHKESCINTYAIGGMQLRREFACHARFPPTAAAKYFMPLLYTEVSSTACLTRAQFDATTNYDLD